MCRGSLMAKGDQRRARLSVSLTNALQDRMVAIEETGLRPNWSKVCRLALEVEIEKLERVLDFIERDVGKSIPRKKKRRR